MNERIEELMHRCYIPFSQDRYDMNKFAELIVRECAKVALQEQIYNERNEIHVSIEQSILEHFGVK